MIIIYLFIILSISLERSLKIYFFEIVWLFYQKDTQLLLWMITNGELIFNDVRTAYLSEISTIWLFTGGLFTPLYPRGLDRGEGHDTQPKLSRDDDTGEGREYIHII